MSRDPVLRLAGLSIKRISGPVSIHYLRPKSQGMPLVLLFGDSHHSISNLAPQCNERDGCYAIYSDSFLLGLDRIATKYPLDFFIEVGDEAAAPLKRNVLFGRLLHKVRGCTDPSMRRDYAYGDECRTRNIRFHKSDPRTMYRYIESEGRALDAFDVKRDDPEIKPTRQHPFISKVFREALGVLHQGRPYDEIQDIMMQVVEHPDSGCGKQIRKVQLEVEWKKMFSFIELTLPSVENYVKAYLAHPEEAEQVLDAIFTGSGLRLSPVQQHFRYQLYHVLLCMNAWFTDLYTAARMLKKPEDNTPSYLSLGMFGYAHTRNLTRFFSEIGYELVYEQRKMVTAAEESVRYVYILQDLDIDHDIEEFKGEDTRPYLTKLIRERRSRESLGYSETQKPFKDIKDERVRELYGIRARFQEDLINIDEYTLRALVERAVESTLGSVIPDKLGRVGDCAFRLARLIVVDLCGGRVNRQLVKELIQACMIGGMKQFISDVEQIVDLIDPEMDGRRYNLVMEMVEDMESRTNYQLCQEEDDMYS